MKKLLFIILIFLFPLNISSSSKLAAAELSTGSTIIVPAYRSFYQIYGTTRDSYALTCTFFLFNIDPKMTIEILSIDSYDSSGKLLKNLIEAPLLVKPRNSKEITIQPRTQPEEDCATYLIIRWKSNQPTNTPIVEVLMVGQVMNRGISFSTRGCEVKE
jgi:hypothetical protein